MNNSTVSSLQSEVQKLKAISSAFLAGVILLFILFGVQVWLLCGSRHNPSQKQEDANTARNLGTDQLPDPSVFELGNIHRSHDDSNNSSSRNDDDHSSETIAYGGFFPSKPLELARGQAQTPFHARHQRTVKSHSTRQVSSASLHSNTRSSRADDNSRVPQARSIHEPVPQRPVPS